MHSAPRTEKTNSRSGQGLWRKHSARTGFLSRRWRQVLSRRPWPSASLRGPAGMAYVRRAPGDAWGMFSQSCVSMAYTIVFRTKAFRGSTHRVVSGTFNMRRERS